MSEPFTREARESLAVAREEAQNNGHNELGTGHLLLGITAVETGAVTRVLRALKVDVSRLRGDIRAVLGKNEHPGLAEMVFTAEVKRVLQFAFEESSELAHLNVGPEHLLLGILREGSGAAARILGESGVNPDLIRLELTRPAPPHSN